MCIYRVTRSVLGTTCFDQLHVLHCIMYILCAGAVRLGMGLCFVKLGNLEKARYEHMYIVHVYVVHVRTYIHTCTWVSPYSNYSFVRMSSTFTILFVHLSFLSLTHSNNLYNICVYIHVHVIVVSWFLQFMGFVPREGCMYLRGLSPRKYIQHGGGTIPCTVKTMRQLTCTERP